MAADEPAVLYVDDEKINLRVFEANFRSRFWVITCSTGEEAVQLLTTRGHEIGVLISDQRMPGMTGVELLSQAKELSPDTQRMVITAYSDMQAVMEAVNLGQVSRYFVKPWVKEDLANALEDSLRIFRLQVRLREFQTQLLQSVRLATIGQVSAGIAHELMNPVSYMSQNVASLRADLETLSAYVRNMLEKNPDKEVSDSLAELPSVIDDVELGAKHIREVALGVRAHARGEDRETTNDLKETANFAVRLARAEVRERARLVVEGPSVRVRGGPVKICQVLLNLIVNAAQAVDGLGRQGLIEVRWHQEDGNVLLSVKDNGCGIPQNLLEKVFQPLFTTKAVGVGTGLGLGISRDFVRDAGGDLRLISVPQEGTTIEITLPVVTTGV
ncbi:MAG: sensor histidine kinase [Myxococcaceae bacterium]